ncbi:asparagine synthase (glutamine-hydrolyzing) [Desulfogranum japonicum]|uniref:asparagine synthase (glutamine-hydrolyzing) n=1 Tax=Desulfogranum japonicum TaxID=231447 RepID=UPI0003FB80D0|nr:asparagine synthase (glutamine-hydrolyzing) [Desulfogranum japonicum]
MCGIAGFFENKDEQLHAGCISRMLDALQHRGPDGRGQTLFQQAALGHVRLAIIDLKGGLQPMSEKGKRFHISYNGELYNYREIRKELQHEGCLFQTDSDTEVILQAYIARGTRAFQDFRGMFAFALWDDKEKRGCLVRDRFGIKPLFYTEYQGILYFASEIKAILKVLPVFPGMNLNGLHLLMNYRYIPGQETLFNNICHLPPGHYLVWQNNRFAVKKWTQHIPVEDNSSLEEIRSCLTTAIRRQLVSDVPLGAYLSGGIDSATICSIASRSLLPERKLPTFTIQTGDSPLEAEQAAETARYLQVDNFQKPVTAQFENYFSRIVYHLEVPKVNAWQSALAAELASNHVKVALSGLGGDEIFLGYNIHKLMAKLSSLSGKGLEGLLRLLGLTTGSFFKLLPPRFEEFGRAAKLLNHFPDVVMMYGILRNVWDTPENRKRLYGTRLLRAGCDDSFAFLRTAWHHNEEVIRATARYEMENKMVNDFLLQEDRLSMAFGLEVRVPFLDEDLVTLVSAIDPAKRMPQGQLKYLMRQAVSAWLPEEILNRPKSGFQVPIEQFFNSHLRGLCLKYLSRKRLLEDGLFNPQFVETVLDARPHFRLRWHYFLLYLMLGVTVWLNLFERGEEIPTWH